MSDKKQKRQLNTLFRIVVILFICAIIVYLFPKVGSFQYEFQKGMPWRYETLTAPFDFPIHKTEDELQEEREKLVQEQSPIFILRIRPICKPVNSGQPCMLSAMKRLPAP